VITGKERPRAASRVVVAGLVGALVGGAVALVTGHYLDHRLVGPWGVFSGTLAFLAAFGVTLARLSGPLQRRLGYLVLALAPGLLSAGVWLFIVAERVPPLTSSGAWLWPLAVCPAVVAVVAVVAALRPAAERAHGDRQ
jgi:hypothetical protein